MRSVDGTAHRHAVHRSVHRSRAPPPRLRFRVCRTAERFQTLRDVCGK